MERPDEVASQPSFVEKLIDVEVDDGTEFAMQVNVDRRSPSFFEIRVNLNVIIDRNKSGYNKCFVCFSRCKLSGTLCLSYPGIWVMKTLMTMKMS